METFNVQTGVKTGGKSGGIKMDYLVMLFVRPKESPIGTLRGSDLRLCYNNKWVDFRDGEIIVTEDDNNAETRDIN